MANKNKQKNMNTIQTDYTNNNITENTTLQNKIYFKIPDFFLDNKQSANQWLDTSTNLFKFNKIQDQRTICTHLINHLPHNILIKLGNKLHDFSKATKPLSELRETLNKFYPVNQDRILEECYHESSLGDKRPSEYLAELQNKLKDENGETNTTLTKFFFLRILPENVKNIILVNKSLSLEEQAALADQIYNKDYQHINAINKPNCSADKNDNETIKMLLKRIETLNNELSQLKEKKRSRDITEVII